MGSSTVAAAPFEHPHHIHQPCRDRGRKVAWNPECVGRGQERKEILGHEWCGRRYPNTVNLSSRPLLGGSSVGTRPPYARHSNSAARARLPRNRRGLHVRETRRSARDWNARSRKLRRVLLAAGMDHPVRSEAVSAPRYRAGISARSSGSSSRARPESRGQER